MANGNRPRRMLLLAQKWREGTITDAEKEEFDQWFNSFDDSELTIGATESEDALRERLYARIKERVYIPEKRPVRRLYARIAVAASLFVAVSVAGYFFFHKQPQKQVAENQSHDIAPGGNKATLTLSDGRKIALANAANGRIATQGSTAVTKKADGQLAYTNSGTSSALMYNMLATKRGEQYAVTLPDGSRAWLNAASSLKYPVAFNGKDRTVELTGEAYFEVVHNSAQPFSVKVKGETVEDIGTHFNINAYDDEPVLKTTLIEGAVRVTDGQRAVKLDPGQASLGTINGTLRIVSADTEEAVAWKSGYFRLNSENLASVMRKVSRWYDAEVVFTDPKLQQQVFAGTLTASRFKNVSQLLSKLQLTGAMHYRIENKKIIISD